MADETQFRSPIPVPQFYEDRRSSISKKIRTSTPCNRRVPPKPPSKSIASVSRLFQNQSLQSEKPVAISFKDNIETSRILNDVEDTATASYFESQFHVDKLIGSGSFGDVFRVKSRSDGRYYAVKKSRYPFKGRTDREHKLKEVAKHEMIPKHPNLVEFFKAWEEKCHLYIQIELCECSLNEFIDNYKDMDPNYYNCPLPEELVWNFLIDLLMALSHLHDHDLIHLDIKPENVFISKGICKLGDFGLMVDLNQKEESDHAIEGDPKYMARELMRGKFSKSADIFSLGITMLEVCCDIDLPSGGEGWHEIRSGTINFDEFNCKISTQLRNVIVLMMSPDPANRPTANGVLNSTPSVKKLTKKRAMRITFVEVSKKLRNFFLLILHYLSLVLFVDYISDIIHVDTKDDSTASIVGDKSLDNSRFFSDNPGTSRNIPISPIRMTDSDGDFDTDNHHLLGIRPLLAKGSKSGNGHRYALRSQKKSRRLLPKDEFDDSFEFKQTRMRSVTSPAIVQSRNSFKNGSKKSTIPLPTIVSPTVPVPKVLTPKSVTSRCPDSPAVLSSISVGNGHSGRKKITPGKSPGQNVTKRSNSCYDFSDDEDLSEVSLLEPNIGPKNLMSIFDQIENEKEK